MRLLTVAGAAHVGGTSGENLQTLRVSRLTARQN